MVTRQRRSYSEAEKEQFAQQRKEKVDELHKQLADNVTRLNEGEAWQKWLSMAAKFHRYSFNNVLLIAVQRPDATLVAGYRAWQSMGHQVTGIARTHTAAVDLAHQKRPDLILADIQLADGSSGIDAVNELLRDMGDIPVIFITAFPERLLTGDRPEPAFLISKPYSEEQVRSAVSQAMYFASTEGLSVA